MSLCATQMDPGSESLLPDGLYLTSTPGPKRLIPYTVELVAGCHATLPDSNPGYLSCTIAGCGGESINGVGNHAH